MDHAAFVTTVLLLFVWVKFERTSQEKEPSCFRKVALCFALTITAETGLRNQILTKNLMTLLMLFPQMNGVQVKKMTQNVVFPVQMAPEEVFNRVTGSIEKISTKQTQN